ncbi:hypothetical protein MRX96_040196 [Rhipicephalus microplus]
MSLLSVSGLRTLSVRGQEMNGDKRRDWRRFLLERSWRRRGRASCESCREGLRWRNKHSLSSSDFLTLT